MSSLKTVMLLERIFYYTLEASMKQASTVKRTTVKPLTTSTVTSSSRVEIPLPQTASTKVDLTQKIAEKAYELYLQRNGAPGSAEEDWAKAEKIVKALHK